MKINNSYISAILLMSLSCANTALAAIQHNGQVALDLSQQVVFEQFASTTYALQLLQARNKFDYKTLVLGGSVEPDFQYWQGDKILTTPPVNYHTGNGLYLTEATLDAMGNISNWGTLFLSISDLQIGQGGESGNYINWPHEFLNIGNLDYFPIYATIGLSTTPFGVFTGSGTWDVPLTYDYFDPNQASLFNIGFYKNNLNLNVFEYRDQVNFNYHFASSLSYNNILGNFTYSVGAGYLTNLETNSTGSIGTTKKRKIPAMQENLGDVWDTNASIGYKIISLNGEYDAGTNRLFNARGKPTAYSLTLSLTPTLFEKVTTFGINHSISLYMRNTPAALPGKDGAQLAAAGLKSTWAMSVSRSVYADNITLGLDAQKVTTYDNQETYAYTLDLLVYI